MSQSTPAMCAVCGAPLSGRRSVSCGEMCRKELARRRARAWYDKHGREDRVLEIRRRASRKSNQKTASDPTRLAEKLSRTQAWRESNRERMAEQNRQWRLANPERAAEKVRRRRARLLDAYVAPVDREEVWSRSGGICGICEQVIDRDRPWPDRMSFTLDHIVPLAKGGTHEPENMQAAHASCNSRKNDRLTA